MQRLYNGRSSLTRWLGVSTGKASFDLLPRPPSQNSLSSWRWQWTHFVSKRNRRYNASAFWWPFPALYTVFSVACSRLSDSGEDAKEKGTRKDGGARKRKGERGSVAPLSPVSSRFIFVFAFSQFSGPDYLGAWNRLFFQPPCQLSP